MYLLIMVYIVVYLVSTDNDVYSQAMVHTEFNDDLELFPYNRNDNADSNEILNVRVDFI